MKLRSESKKSSGLNIVVRHLESLIRLSCASAKIHLRHTVTKYDCSNAISLLLTSFINSQKPSIAINLKQKFNYYLKRSTDHISKLSFILNNLINQQIIYKRIKKKSENFDEISEVKVLFKEFEAIARENHIQDIRGFLKKSYFVENFRIETIEDNDFIVKKI